MSVPYRSLAGGYLVPRWSMRQYEGWRAAYSVTEPTMPGHTPHAGGSGKVALVQGPKIEGDFALRVESHTAAGPTYGDGIAVSLLPVDLSGYDGIGVATNVTDVAFLASVRVRFYTNWETGTPDYFEYSYEPVGPTSVGASYYDAGLYGIARYAGDVEGEMWGLKIIPKGDFTAVNSPSWADIERAELTVVVGGGYAEVFFDALSGWVSLEPEDAHANRMMSNLPEYHWDQNFNDAYLQTLGHELDALRAMLEYGLDQRIPQLAEWGLRAHEMELALPVEPRLWPEVKRRALVTFVSGMPVTLPEFEAGLSAIVGAPVVATPNYGSQSVEFAATLTDPLDQAMMKLAIERTLPAHLLYTTDFT